MAPGTGRVQGNAPLSSTLTVALPISSAVAWFINFKAWRAKRRPCVQGHGHSVASGGAFSRRDYTLGGMRACVFLYVCVCSMRVMPCLTSLTRSRRRGLVGMSFRRVISICFVPVVSCSPATLDQSHSRRTVAATATAMPVRPKS